MANDRPSAPRPAVSLVVVNARVWTGDPRRPWADALAVRGSLLATVGSSAEVRKSAPATARVVDARGAMVVARPPGPLVRGTPASFVLLPQGADPRLGSPDPPSAVGRPIMEVAGGELVHEDGTPGM